MRRAAAVLGVALLATAFAGCLEAGDGPRVIPAAKRVTATDFTFTAFDGRDHNLSDFRGRTVIVDLMSQSCATCEGESRALQAAARATPDGGASLVLLLFDASPRDPPDWMRDYAERHGFGEVYLGYAPDAVTRTYGAVALDWNLVVDSEGRIAYRDETTTDEAAWRDLLATL
ncbi:MAG TPA: TlpA disulfide reductase family protein [Candidatus Thermoplasmatota archaeon]|nr:TlpA disulfide reductase family protein [Candidatus Thermoplasmatota archaeon]